MKRGVTTRSRRAWKTVVLRIGLCHQSSRQLIRLSASMTSGQIARTRSAKESERDCRLFPASVHEHYAYFQIVLLAYNSWRSFKMLAEFSEKQNALKITRQSPP